jgi:toxin ParE1/3/4
MASAKRSLVWSPEAEQDLLDIWLYLAPEASAGTADAQLRKIDATCRSLLMMPFRGRPRNELRPGLRSVLVHPYAAFYGVGESTIDIVRVLHQRRDIDAILKEP